jgi:hypothetical protein
MKKLIYAIVLLGVVLASCSSPKYTYHFDHYNYKSGKANKGDDKIVEASGQTEVFPEPVNEQTLLATNSEAGIVTADINTGYHETPGIREAQKINETTAIPALTRAEKRELRKEAVKSIKEYAKAVKAGDTDKADKMAKAMDADLRWAAIFGAVGIVSLIIGGDVFWIIGAAALIVATVFLVRYLIRQ